MAFFGALKVCYEAPLKLIKSVKSSDKVLEMQPKEPVDYFEEFFRIPMSSLRFVGWRPSQKTEPRWCKFYHWFVIISNAFMLTNASIQLAAVFGDKNKLSVIINLSSMISFVILSSIKMIDLIFKNRKERAVVLEKVKSYLHDTDTNINDEKVQQNLRKFTIVWQGIRAGFLVAIVANLLRAPVMMAIDWSTKDEAFSRVVFPIWYPYETSSPVWIIVWLIQAVTFAYSTFFCIIGSDAMFSAIIIIVCLRFQALKEKIQKAETNQQLNNCVAVHVDLIETCEKLSKIYESIIFCNLFIASLRVCFIGYLIVVWKLEKSGTN
jgi:7tm Odorant receptor